MKIVFATVMLFFLAVAGCKTAKYLPDTFEKRQIHFGSGGGFTGINTTFMMLENGQIFKQTSLQHKAEELQAHKKKDLKTYFSAVAGLPQDSIPFIHPGNMSKYLYVIKGEDTLNRYVWGDYKYPVADTVAHIYVQLLDLVKTNPQISDTTKYER